MANGRIYSVLMDAISVSAAKDLIRLSAPSDGSLLIHQVIVTQEGSETSDQVAIQLQRSSTDGTGTSYTAKKFCEEDPAFGGSAVTNLTADTTAGDILHREGMNMLAGFNWLPTPEMRPLIPASGRFVVRLDVAPAAATTMTAVVIFEER